MQSRFFYVAWLALNKHKVMLNYKKLVAHKPTIYNTFTNSLGQKIELVEHPTLGDMTEVIAICHELKLAGYTEFFECEEIMEVGGDYEVLFVDRKIMHGYEIDRN